jgi:hypothetical protein
MQGPIYIIVTAVAIASFVVAGFFLVQKFIFRSRDAKQNKLKEEQRNAIRYALEIFQPFHWEALHFAILSEEYKRNGYPTNDEKCVQRSELIQAYSTSFQLLQDELNNLDGKIGVREINNVQTALTLNLRDELQKVILKLSEACRLAQEPQDLKECFTLIQAAYYESAQIEKTLRSLYRRSS